MLPTAGSAFSSYSEEPWGLCKYRHKRSRVTAAAATKMCRIHSGWAAQWMVCSGVGWVSFWCKTGTLTRRQKRKKYLVEQGSTCQGFRSAVGESYRQPGRERCPCSHMLRTILKSWTKHAASYCLESPVPQLFSLKLSKICYPAGLEPWCLTLCSQNYWNGLPGLP